jgi:hypothetical protein
MNFPLENPILQFFYWLVNTPGLGGIGVGLIVIISVSSYAGALYWVVQGAQADEPETYAYPTPALHEHS